MELRIGEAGLGRTPVIQAERFWNQYRPGGDLYREYPTIGEYNRAVYSLLSTNKFTPQDAAYAVRKAYEQQRFAGFTNSDFVPRNPGNCHKRNEVENGN